jgi:hypothetical protein
MADLQQHPGRAIEDNIRGVPCLVEKRPAFYRLVGELAIAVGVLRGLGPE